MEDNFNHKVAYEEEIPLYLHIDWERAYIDDSQHINMGNLRIKRRFDNICRMKELKTTPKFHHLDIPIWEWNYDQSS